MDDRELLELAAKAAGIKWDRTEECWYADPHVRPDWNPLTDDGDAFRVAINLQISVHRSDLLVWVGGQKAQLMMGDDALAVTRRLIVRAAAELGRTQGSTK